MRILPLISSVALLTDGALIANSNKGRATVECASGIFILLRELASNSVALKHSSVKGKYVLEGSGTYVWRDQAVDTSSNVATPSEMQEIINDGITA